MKNSKSKFKKIMIITFIVVFIFEYLIAISNFIPENVLPDEKKIYLILIAIIVLIMVIIKFSFIIIIYFIWKRTSKNIQKEKLSEIDIKGSSKYFRDLLSNYNPLVLSYIDDFELMYPKDICVILLDMQCKNIIKLEDDKIVILNNKVEDELYKFILDSISEGKIRKLNKLKLKFLVQKHALNYNLVEYSPIKFNAFKIIGFIISFILITIILFKYAINFQNTLGIVFFIVVLLIWIVFMITINFYPIYIIIYLIKRSNNPYQRNKTGDSVNEQLEGLKNYLKDFSSLDEKTINEIIIWDDYLIYSVLFNQNKNIIETMYKKYFL